MNSLPLGTALALTFVVCAAYALVLSTEWGERWATAKTWTTVVLGVALVLGGVALVDTAAAWLAARFFVAGGLPIIVRSLWIEFREYEGARRRAQGE